LACEWTKRITQSKFLSCFLHAATVGERGVCVLQTCTDAQSACKTAPVGTTCPTQRSKWLRRCAFSDLCRSSAVNLPPGGGIGVRVLPASRVLVPKCYACAFLAQQEKPKTQPESHATVSYTAYNLAFLHFEFRSRYISRYAGLKFDFLPFVVATIVAMVFFFAVLAARTPAMGNSADRAWQLSQLVEGVLTAFNPSAWQPVLRQNKLRIFLRPAFSMRQPRKRMKSWRFAFAMTC